MESVSNIATAASRAIFGEQGQSETSQNYNTTQTTNTNETGGVEPISGEEGDVRRGEPYDKGNLDPTTTEANTNSASKDSATSQYDPVSGSAPTQSSNNPVSAAPTSGSNPAVVGNTPSRSENAPPTGPSHAESETGKTAKSAFNNPTSETTTTGPTSADDNSGPGASPSVGADPASGARPKVKQQGADKPHDKPDSDESQKIQDTKREAEEAADTSKKVDGPGPMTLEEKARSGGNAGAGAGGEDEDGPGKPSTGEGTGEKYVKSSGMKAEGGDFDAANPGAGREADRLLEEKGIHREGGESKGNTDDAAESATKPQKHGFGEKIKAKLHKH